jgi:hypothetical protein
MAGALLGAWVREKVKRPYHSTIELPSGAVRFCLSIVEAMGGNKNGRAKDR